ncbi:MAG: YicC/YloC family endoribonuclease [Syntrophales bacterium]
MIRSMTGYGRAEVLIEEKMLVVEMKSFNHRYLDVSLRLPAILSLFEFEIRKKIGENFSRGRVEVAVRIDSESELEKVNRLELNLPLIRNYHALLVKLKEELNLKGEITMDLMAGFKDVFVPLESGKNLVDMWERIENTLDEAITNLVQMRGKEGEVIYRDLTSRVDTIMEYLDSITSRTPQVVIEYQTRVTDRVKELTDGIVVIDDSRLAQEVAIMAEKMDITEEIVRLKSHIGQFFETIDSEDAVGRKVNFLLQEMVREVNTIGSKSCDSYISQRVVEIKSELTKLKEQVQNLE